MNLKFCIASLCLSAMLVTGCSKDSTSVLSTKMSATVDGVAWSATVPLAVKSSYGFVITGTQASLAGSTSTLVITLKGTTTGTYTLIATTNNCVATYTPSILAASDSYASLTSGTVNLTEINTTDKTITGTFSFPSCSNTALKSVAITNGKFTDLKYTDASTK